MKYLKYTYVDSATGVSVVDAPAKNGPAQPDVDGLEFGFALESQYPTHAPTFYGACPAGSDANALGVLEEVSESEYQEALDSEMLARHRKTIPQDVEGWQAEVAMRVTLVDLEDEQSQNVWDRVEEIIASMPDGPEKVTAQIVLKRGRLRRDSAMLAVLAPLVPLSSDRVDAMFVLADSIEA